MKGLFTVDFDGTFLRDDRTLADIDRKALAALRKRGVVTVIATGRSLYSFQKTIAALKFDEPGRILPIDYLIFSTGAGIMDFPAATILKKYSLGADEVTAISAALDDCGLDYMVHRSVPHTEYFLYREHTGVNRDFQSRLTLYRQFAVPLTPERLDRFGRATQLVCIVARERGDEVAGYLANLFPQQSVIKATSPLDGQSAWVEIFAGGVSKSSAMRWLSEKTGVPQYSTAAVGNDYNDEDMLDWAADGYLVANGPVTLQSRYPIVASNNEGGVSEAVYHWMGRRCL